MTKISILRNKIVETVEKITDEAVLTSMLVFASTAQADQSDGSGDGGIARGAL